MLHKIFVLFFVIIGLLFQIHVTYAIESPTNLRVLQEGDTQLMLDWEDVTGAVGYYVYYGTKTGVNGNYEVEGVDIIEESDFLLSDLSPDTQYFLAITAIDESVNESELSQEVVHTTLSLGSDLIATTFRVEQVSVIDETSMEIQFSKNLNTAANSVREFILEKKSTQQEIFISVSEVDEENPNRLIALLDSPLEPNTEYELTVLDIQDEEGGSIMFGIDAFASFKTGDFDEDIIDLNSASPQDEEQSTNGNTQIEDISNDEGISQSGSIQNDGDSTQTNETQQNSQNKINEGNNAGETINLGDIEDNTLMAASETDTLPQTGPEHWILLFFALVGAAGIYYKQKNSDIKK